MKPLKNSQLSTYPLFSWTGGHQSANPRHLSDLWELPLQRSCIAEPGISGQAIIRDPSNHPRSEGTNALKPLTPSLSHPAIIDNGHGANYLSKSAKCCCILFCLWSEARRCVDLTFKTTFLFCKYYGHGAFTDYTAWLGFWHFVFASPEWKIAKKIPFFTFLYVWHYHVEDHRLMIIFILVL